MFHRRAQDVMDRNSIHDYCGDMDKWCAEVGRGRAPFFLLVACIIDSSGQLQVILKRPLFLISSFVFLFKFLPSLLPSGETCGHSLLIDVCRVFYSIRYWLTYPFASCFIIYRRYSSYYLPLSITTSDKSS
jgi:hypothetical protein